MSKHHLRFGGTISWKKLGDETVEVRLTEKYITPVTVWLAKKHLRAMLDLFEESPSPYEKTTAALFHPCDDRIR